ncbi:MAG: biopolymer transporter ExbD, partial [Acidobacteria bacterium]|nr:biopolymer transporter ExbD [Acidobacteriota bacterium]
MRINRAVPAINVTPLIDVLLVLLIIFMVMSPLRAARFKTLVPGEPARQKEIAANICTLVVSLDGRGGLRLNGGGPLGTARDTSRLAETLAEL